ncbi:MAG: aldolase/citrate lyase family protein [Dongiaceae bacterium]
MTFLNMKNPLRARLAGGSPAYGVWITLSDPTVTEIVVELGADWICVDMEHGSLDYKDVVAHARAARGSGAAVLTRVPAFRIDTVKRALDLGVDGVILPLVRSAADVEEGFQYARYPGRGIRGVGGERAVHWGLRLQEYLAIADRETMVIPIIETRQAAADFDNIVRVEGLEAIFFGPADLSASCGHLGHWEGPGVAEDILRILGIARAHDVAAGLMAWDEEDVARRVEQGFRLIGLGADVGFLAKPLKSAFGRFKGTRYPAPWR